MYEFHNFITHFRKFILYIIRSLNMEQFELLMTHFAAVTDMDPPSETELQNFMQAMDTMEMGN